MVIKSQDIIIGYSDGTVKIYNLAESNINLLIKFKTNYYLAKMGKSFFLIIERFLID